LGCFKSSVIDVIKLFLEEIWISPKLRNWTKFVLMSEPAQKCENNAIFKQHYTLELFLALEMVCYCCFSLGGNLDFLDFLAKKFYNINYWSKFLGKSSIPNCLLGAFHKVHFFHLVLNLVKLQWLCLWIGCLDFSAIQLP